MMRYSRGYVGLLALLVVTALIAFIIFKQYESFGFTKLIKNESSIEPGTNSGILTPIDRAKNIKNVLEARDQSNFGQ